ACGNKAACDAYCESSDHMEECVTFGEAAGFLQGKELEDAKKMLTAIKSGVKPLPCQGKDACDQYCASPDNMEACINFAIEAGFMSDSEKADSQKMLQALKKGVKPPSCNGKEACDAYCATEEHFSECTDFAVAAGFMSEEDAVMAKKTGGKGPGGCRNQEECDAFCNNPDNQQACFDFAKENGLISEEDMKKINEGAQQFNQSFVEMPPAVVDCIASQVGGADQLEKMKSGALMAPKNIGDIMSRCVEIAGPRPNQGPPPEGNSGGTAQTGPGGCASPEECEAYCNDHIEECMNYAPQTLQENMIPGAGSGSNPNPPMNQFAPGTEGGNTFPPPPVSGQTCATPEQCRNTITNPFPCEGDNCMQPPTQPPSAGSICSSAEECREIQNNLMNAASCQGENCFQSPPPAQQMSPGETLFIAPSQNQMPPSDFQPPPVSPPEAPAGEQPPSSGENPPPTSLVDPRLLMGLLLPVFEKAALFLLR
ncbi:MAG: hypothetical protein PHV93_05140, partial [Candidatus Pacebacteria bacterium]|nr:hypothetical protein [Candidatus Paceibacterota bacterium]